MVSVMGRKTEFVIRFVLLAIPTYFFSVLLIMAGFRNGVHAAIVLTLLFLSVVWFSLYPRKMKWWYRTVVGFMLQMVVLGAIFAGHAWFNHQFPAKVDQTRDVYVIPEGYEGPLFVVSDVKGAPTTKRENGKDVFTFNKEGYYVTATTDKALGFGSTSDDSFYYENAAGLRKPISKAMVTYLDSGGIEQKTADGKVYKMNARGVYVSTNRSVALTNSFQSEMNDALNKVYQKVSQKYYGLKIP
jgi:hypothetical protein